MATMQERDAERRALSFAHAIEKAQAHANYFRTNWKIVTDGNQFFSAHENDDFSHWKLPPLWSKVVQIVSPQ